MAAPRKRRTQRRSARTPARPTAGIDPFLLDAMSLRVGTRGRERRLTGREVERALLSGEHARTLEAYFGEAEYDELRQLAARATRRTGTGPRVLILPGILGSMLARKRSGSLDTLWIDFWDIVRGQLKRLALPSEDFVATDVHQSTYLKLKLRLQEQGWDADFHPFDWRLDLPALGRELAERVAKDPADKVYLVAHSMGGLVARAAFQHAPMKKVERLVMLGTPNFGSFAPAMVIRGVYPFLRKIAAIDLGNSAEDLAGKVFNTHPGLTQMLPQRAKFSAVDLYDAAQWPSQGPRPLAALLRAAPAAQQKLQVVPEKFVMVAGVDRETTVGLRVEEGEFVFERSRAGDGTVPLEMAVLPDIVTFYHPEEHGSLPKNAAILSALPELLREGDTSSLARRWDANRGDLRAEVRESELRAMFEAQATRGEVTASDLRNILAEVAAPSTPASLSPMPVQGPAPAAHLFESLVISRRRQRRLEVRLARGSVTQVPSQAYVLGLFEAVAPAGAASAIDALMGGAISEFRRRRMFSSAVGEVFMVPAGQHEVRAQHVAFAGLGSFDHFGVKVLEIAAENVARTLARTCISDFVTVPIGVRTGVEMEATLEAMLRGFLRGLSETDGGQSFRSVTFCEIDEERYELLKWALYRLSASALFDGVEVTFSELSLPPSAPVRRSVGSGLPPAIYLDVRTSVEGKGARSFRFEASLLTAGAKATVMSGEKLVREVDLKKHLQKIEGQSFNHSTLPAFGKALAGLVLDETLVAGIRGCRGSHVVVVHDQEASRIPWETLCFEGVFPALEGGMTRRYRASNLSVAKWLEQRRTDEWLDVLLVVDPTQDLAGARSEGDRLEKLLASRKNVRLKRVQGAEATHARLRSEFASGAYDILHYAGHAFFDPDDVSRSGILCAGQEGLSGAELAGMGNLPSLVFFNACESARVRSRVRRESVRVSRDLRERIVRNVGLAEAFLRGGVANYLGTYWPVGDESASAFAGTFYDAVVKGATLAAALHEGRRAVERLESQDWADYIFYGSPDFRVKAASEDGT